MMQRQAFVARTTTLQEKRQVKVVISTETQGRDGLVVVTSGIDVTDYRRNPVVLWGHDPAFPIAKATTITAEGAALTSLAQFPAAGVSAKADEIFGLIGAGIVNGASIGFDVTEAEPLDPKKPYDGQRILKCTLMEYSFVSIPALPDALVTERGRRASDATDWRCGAADDLPLDTDPDRKWDADAAMARVFRWAGFDGSEPNPERATRAFLAHDLRHETLREGYKLPFCDVIAGRLTAVRRGIDAAASMLNRADIPPNCWNRAREVLDAYRDREPGRGRRPSAARHSLAYHLARAERVRRDLKLERAR